MAAFHSLVQVLELMRQGSNSGLLTPFSCARSVSSFAPSRVIAPENSVANLGFTTFLDLVSRWRSPTFTASWLSTTLNFLSASIVLLRLLFNRPGTTFPTGQSPSFWSVKSFSALIKLSQVPCGAAWARELLLLGGPCCLVWPRPCSGPSNHTGRHKPHMTPPTPPFGVTILLKKPVHTQ